MAEIIRICFSPVFDLLFQSLPYMDLSWMNMKANPHFSRTTVTIKAAGRQKAKRRDHRMYNHATLTFNTVLQPACMHTAQKFTTKGH